MRFKHNKKRNTAFLFEALIQELTKSVIASNEKKRQTILNILKENFNTKTALGKELKLYNSIIKCEPTTPKVAERIITEACQRYLSLDKKDIFNEQSIVIERINKEVSREVFSNFIPNYKMYATVHQIFKNEMEPSDKVLLEQGVVKKITLDAALIEEKQVPSDVLVYKNFIKEFNDKYKDLNEQQKVLLNKYITSFSDNGLEFKIFLNEEIYRIKEKLNEATENNEDQLMVEKINKISEMIDRFRNEKIDDKILEKILKIQTLTQEVL